MGIHSASPSRSGMGSGSDTVSSLIQRLPTECTLCRTGNKAVNTLLRRETQTTTCQAVTQGKDKVKEEALILKRVVSKASLVGEHPNRNLSAVRAWHVGVWGKAFRGGAGTKVLGGDHAGPTDAKQGALLG